MPHHITRQARQQSRLFPEAIDDFFTEDNPARVIEVFVEHLDLRDLGFENVMAKSNGRPGYQESTLLASVKINNVMHQTARYIAAI
jgi:transposase